MNKYYNHFQAQSMEFKCSWLEWQARKRTDFLLEFLIPVEKSLRNEINILIFICMESMVWRVSKAIVFTGYNKNVFIHNINGKMCGFEWICCTDSNAIAGATFSEGK